jgi:hypothetical protein
MVLAHDAQKVDRRHGEPDRVAPTPGGLPVVGGGPGPKLDPRAPAERSFHDLSPPCSSSTATTSAGSGPRARTGGRPARPSRRLSLAVVLIDVQAVLVAIPGLALVALIEQRPRAFSMPLLGEHPTSQAWAWGLVLMILAGGLVVLGIEARARRSGAVIGLYVAELVFAGSALLALSPQRGVIGLLTAVTVLALIASDRRRERRTGPRDRVGSADGVGTPILPLDSHRHVNGLVTTPRRAPTAMSSAAPCP